jgi:hypothetical protein
MNRTELSLEIQIGSSIRKQGKSLAHIFQLHQIDRSAHEARRIGESVRNNPSRRANHSAFANEQAARSA